MTEPRPLRRDEAAGLAAEEYGRLLNLVEGLPSDVWQRRTDCTDWDVRQLVAHVVGMAELGASLREALRQLWAGRSTGLKPPHSFNVVQVAERADHEPDRLVAELRDVAPRAVRGRWSLSAPLRRLPVPLEFSGRRTLDWLFTVVLTRDMWMHRVDLARATGSDLVLTPEHDGRLVADVVAEWAGLHGQAYDLTLTGPAGGRFRTRSDGAPLEMDAVQFCRVLGGRAPGDGLLATRVDF